MNTNNRETVSMDFDQGLYNVKMIVYCGGCFSRLVGRIRVFVCVQFGFLAKKSTYF